MDIVFEHHIVGVECEDFQDQGQTQRACNLVQDFNQVPSASIVYGMFEIVMLLVYLALVMHQGHLQMHK